MCSLFYGINVYNESIQMRIVNSLLLLLFVCRAGHVTWKLASDRTTTETIISNERLTKPPLSHTCHCSV